MRDYAAAPSESLGMSHRPLTDEYLHALRAVARGEVFRTYNSQKFTLTGPCSSRLVFRNISWDEWLSHFDRYRLLFVYEEEIADRAYALWKARGGEHGNDRQDWFEAERQLRDVPSGPGGRYWLVPQDSRGKDK